MKHAKVLNKQVSEVVSGVRGLRRDVDMVANNDVDIDVRFAGLQQRVTGLENAVQGVATQISNLATTINERSRTPWGILLTGAGVVITVLVVIGGLASRPYQEGIDRIEMAVRDLGQKAVTRDEIDWRTARSKEDRERVEKMLSELRTDMVPRGEHDQKWRAYDTEIAAIQRQVDDLKQTQANTYSARDLLLDLRERLDRLERERAALKQSG